MNSCEIILPAGADRDTWLAERRRGLSSTDAAAVAGVSPFRTALDVYLDKRGLLPETQVNARMEWGTRLEPLLADAYRDHTGRALDVPPKLVRSRELPWLLASLDRVADDGRLVELKTARTAEGWGDGGTDEVPDSYALQVAHQLLVTGAPAADVAVLIGGSDFRVYHLTRHPDLLARLLVIESDFWRKHEANDTPEPDWKHPRTAELVARMYGVEEVEIELGPLEAALAMTYRHLGEEIKELDKQRDEAKGKLLLAMGNAATATLPDGVKLNRRTVKRKAYEVPEGEYVRFSVSNPKVK